MFALVITLSLISGGFASILCPKEFNPNETIHLAHPTSCSKFLTCVGTFPVEQDCPAGLHWNVEHSRCDYPGFPQCTRDSDSDQLEPRSFNAKAVASSVCLPQSYQCPLNSKPEEQVVFLKHRDCRKFYACVSTNPVELSCPPKLYWNSRSCACDYEKEEECDEMMARVEEDAPEEADEVEHEPSQQEETDVAEQPAQNEDAPEAVDGEENPAQEQDDIPEEAYEEQAEPEGIDNAEESVVARKRRAADGSSSSNNDSSSSSGSGSSGSGSGGSGSSGSGSSGSGSSGSGSDGSGSGGSPTQSGADIRTVSSIVMVVATVIMCTM